MIDVLKDRDMIGMQEFVDAQRRIFISFKSLGKYREAFWTIDAILELSPDHSSLLKQDIPSITDLTWLENVNKSVIFNTWVSQP